MAAGVNSCQFVGRVGKQPDIRYAASGTCIANLSLAVDERYKDKAGEWQTKTEWIPVTFFGRTAEVIGEHVGSGDLLYVSGSFTTRKWEDKEKNTRYSSEIRGDRMQMLGSKGGKGEGGNKGQGGGGQGQPNQYAEYQEPEFDDSTIPF